MRRHGLERSGAWLGLLLGLLLGIGLAGACFNAPQPAVQFSCDPADAPQCPDGYTCEPDGCCHLDGSDYEANAGACQLGGGALTGGPESTGGTTGGTTGASSSGGPEGSSSDGSSSASSTQDASSESSGGTAGSSDSGTTAGSTG